MSLKDRIDLLERDVNTYGLVKRIVALEDFIDNWAHAKTKTVNGVNVDYYEVPPLKKQLKERDDRIASLEARIADLERRAKGALI